MLKKTLAIVCAGFLLGATGARAQNLGTGLLPQPDQSTTRVGTRGANFLEIPIGARGQALGASGGALIDGAQGLAWNVASAASVEGFSLAFDYTNLFADTDIDLIYAAAVFSLNDVSALGITVTSLNSGDIIRTTEDFPEGGDPQFGETFKFNGFAAGLTYARAITDRLNVGAQVKLVSEGLDDAKVDWVALDVAALFRTGLVGTTLGATITNIGGDANYSGSAVERIVAAGTDAFQTEDNVPVSFDTRALTLPTAFRFSVVADVIGSAEAWVPSAGTTSQLKLALDFYDSISTALQPSLGLEYSFRELIFGRLGKRWYNEESTSDFRDFSDGFALGAGLKIPILKRFLQLDYAYTDRGILENTQTFSLQFGT